VEVYNGRVGATASPVQTKVIPKLVEIGKGLSYTANYMQGPPSPSKTLMLARTSGGTAGTGAAGSGEVVGSEDGTGGEKQKSSLSPHIRKDIVPAYMWISAPAVARNGIPKTMGT